MLRFTVASAYQKQLVPFQNVNQDKRPLPQRLQWLSRFPSLARSLEVDGQEGGHQN
jgi:hypothetical protein